ncbi:MAG: DUF167 family protein [Rhodospirillaceae bacterium]|nr:DUF167 family protein [Rhodospirillaceae bacterium]MDD9927410.1 DUF167 family protein [Rhodospirillaceae bacterium]
MSATPFWRTDDGAIVTVRLSPKAKANRIVGVATLADGTTALKARVTAAPERGKANAALIALLAKEWRLPKSSFQIAAGATDRRKRVAVTGDPDTLQQFTDDWMAKHHG